MTAAPAALTFTASDWDSPQTVTVAAGHDDDAVDGAATVTHTAAGGGYDAVSATVEVTVDDDDHPRVAVSFGAASYSVAESDDAATAAREDQAVVTVTLSAVPERTVEIPITATGQDGATAGDWSGVPAAVTFEAGTTEAAFALAATDDDIDDDGQSVEVAFGLLPDRVSADPAAATATVAIDVDDDRGVELSETRLAVAEGEVGSYTVRLRSQPTGAVTVTVTGHAGTDVAPDPESLHYTPRTGTPARRCRSPRAKTTTPTSTPPPSPTPPPAATTPAPTPPKSRSPSPTTTTPGSKSGSRPGPAAPPRAPPRSCGWCLTATPSAA